MFRIKPLFVLLSVCSAQVLFAGHADLVVRSIDASNVRIDQGTRAVSGSAIVEIENAGAFNVLTVFNNTIFEDRNGDGQYNAGDLILGSSKTVTPKLLSHARVTLTINLSGTLANLSNKLYVFTDSDNNVKESFDIITGLSEQPQNNNIRLLATTPAHTAVDLELALVVDVSTSIDASEFDLQRQGYAQAFRNPEIIAAIQAGKYHGIAVTAIQFGSCAYEAIPFTLINSAPAANAFADQIATMPRLSSGATGIANGLTLAASRFAFNNFDGVRKVIDISGDGVESLDPGGGCHESLNSASFPYPYVESVTDQVDTVNGLPIGDNTLADFYKKSVIAGSGAFIVPVSGLRDFAAGILLKLKTEISGAYDPQATISDLLARAKDGAVGLSWSPITAALSYNIYRRTQGQPYQLVRSGITVTAIDDAPIPNGVTYYYSVRWVNAAGQESGDSTEPSAMPVGRLDRNSVAPTILSKPVMQMTGGQAYSYQVSASSPVTGVVLRYSLTSAPAGMQIAVSTGLVTWTPPLSVSGYQTVAVRVEDQAGHFATQTYRPFVIAPQISQAGPPIMAGPSNVSTHAGYPPISFTVYAASEHAFYPLTFAVTGSTENPGCSSTNVSINSTTGVITASFSVGHWNPCVAVVSATDSRAALSTHRVLIDVQDNHAPSFTSMPVISAEAGSPYTYQAIASDPEGDALRYSLDAAPPGMTIDPVTGIISWVPAPGQTGVKNVAVRATDLGRLFGTQSFSLTVFSPDVTPPVVSFNSPASGANLNLDAAINGTIVDTNLASWTLDYKRVGDPNWTVISSQRTPTTPLPSRTNSLLGFLPVTLLSNDAYRLRLTASDYKQSASAEIEVVVNSGALKLGDYTTSFEDLRIPGLGFPIAVIRKYDSKEPQSGDFGLGWSLDFTSVYVRTDVNKNVFMTLSDGRRVMFQFSPVPIGLGVYNNRYVAQAGVFDTLENTDCQQFFGSPPNVLCKGAPYAPQNYILRTKAGFKYTLTASGGIRRIEDRNGNFLTISPTGITTNFGQSIVFERDGEGRINRIVEVGGAASLHYGYDAVGRLIQFTDQAGNITKYFYENAAFMRYLTKIEDPLGRPVVRYVYAADGRLRAQCDANGNVTTLAGCAQFAYGTTARTQTVLNGRGFRTDLFLDARGNILTERRYTNFTLSTFLDTVRTYDPNDNVLTEKDPAGNTKTFTYDPRGNKLTDTDPGGHTTTYTYAACDKVATETDAAGNTTTYTYDAACNLRFVKDALNNTTEYRYNAQGQRTHFIDAIGNTWIWAYQANGLLKSLTDPFGKATTFTFSDMGDLLTRVDRNNRQIDFTYDTAHRLRVERWANGHTATFDYYDDGQLKSAVDPDSAIAITYYNTGRLWTVDNLGTPGAPRVVMTYGYDENGNVTRVQDSLGGLTDYTYDAVDRLARVTQSGAGVQEKRVDMHYDDASLLIEMKRFANLAGSLPVANTRYIYDCGGCAAKVKTIRHRQASDDSVIHDLTFTRDDLGNIKQMTDAEGTHNYTYDNIRRLLTATHSNPMVQPDESYTYDAAGNRLTSHLSRFYTYSYQTVGKGNRLLQDSQFNYAYDDEGNQIRRTDRTTGVYTDYSYDFRNRMTTAIQKTALNVETARSEHAYDVLDRRIRAAEGGQASYFGYDGLNPVLKLTATGSAISRRLYGTGLDAILADEAASERRWFLTDQVGTVRNLASNAAAELNHYTYDSFGRLLTQTNPNASNDLLFTAREFNQQTGLGYFRKRSYDPRLGRFTQHDPLLPSFYGYASSNPLSFTDSLGLSVSESTLIKAVAGSYVALKLAFYQQVVLTVFCSSDKADPKKEVLPNVALNLLPIPMPWYLVGVAISTAAECWTRQ